jgi:aspartyl-tRNA(Asn)/glutamyl-tRNA(Gln) amidotransferase subunit B
VKWEAVIGLEVHVQLRTASKMFCACENRFGAEPNTLVCPVCLGLPGALPVLNEAAVGLALRLGVALGCTVRRRSVFARKNYFYPDLPKNYQISQYDEPLLTGGELAIGSAQTPRAVALHRVHLEEDAGKSFHPEGPDAPRETRVDFNRSGVPLVEMVTEPELRSPEEAYVFLTRFRQLARVLGVTDGDMEKGSLRCDANVSLRPAGAADLGVKTEIKNLNSIRGVERGLAAEIRRQTALLDGGGRVEQCTLLYDADRDALAVMRSKEFAHDYRYFPEPDLPPLVIREAEIERARRELPELPAARQARLAASYGLPPYDAEVLVADYPVADYFEALVGSGVTAKTASNWVMGEVLRALKERGWELSDYAVRVPAARLAELVALQGRGLVSGNLAKEVFERMLDEPGSPESLAVRHGLVQESDPGVLEPLVDEVLAKHPDAVREFLAGKEKAFGFLVGQLMRATGGRADPKAARRLLEDRIAAQSPGQPS